MTNSAVPPLALATEIAPRPRDLEETGLSTEYLGDLLLKHLYAGGVLGLGTLAERMALSGILLEELSNLSRADGYVEVRGSSDSGLRFALTERGRAEALDAMIRNSYAGPAPVPLAAYERIVKAQSVHDRIVTKDTIRQAFANFVIREELLDQLGPALHSGRAIFIYGPAGTGKTYTTKQLMNLLSDTVLIPHAISVNEATIPLFDPVVHKAEVAEPGGNSLLLDQGHDPRYIRCQRPNIVTGGELSLDMLDLHFDAINKEYQVPLQLKANNGIFLLDDLGRQRAATMDLFNRWIVPLEEQHDYLSLGSGKHFQVPFDLVLVFSTNLNPLELADEAFLRRLGYKIAFTHLSKREYIKIWWQVCKERDIECDPETLGYVMSDLHARHDVPLLPCHPRDLLDLALDRCHYLGQPKVVTVEALEWAWDNYFIRLEQSAD